MGGGSGFQLPKLPNTPSTVAGTLGGSTSYVVGGSLSTLSFDGSSGAFKDPTAPTLPRDDRPFWKIQEERRRKQVRKKMMVGVTDVDINKASIMGTLVGERRARPPDMKKMLHEHMTPRDKDGKKVRTGEERIYDGVPSRGWPLLTALSVLCLNPSFRRLKF